MTAESHQRLLDAIAARRKLAQAAEGHSLLDGTRVSDGPWTVDAEPWTQGVGVADNTGCGVAVAIGSYAAEHIVANDPAQILRDTAAHLRIVERHKPALPYTDPLRGEVDPFGPRRVCVRCDEEDWPCPDWLDVASSYPEGTAPSCA